MNGDDDKPDFLDGTSVAKILETHNNDDSAPSFFKEGEPKEPNPEENPELTYQPPPPNLIFGGDESIDPEFLKTLNTTPDAPGENVDKNAQKEPDFDNVTLTEIFDKSRNE